MSSRQPSSSKQAFADHLLDLLRELGPVRARAMFGGHGLFLDGVMFALLANEQMYLKFDEQTIALFNARQLSQFQYEARGKTVALSYCRAPAEAMESAEHALVWGRLGLQAAMRANVGKALKKSEPKQAVAALAQPMAEALNIGLKSQEMLAKAGIQSLADLQALGSVRAYLKTKAVWPKVSLNLLWALEGALTERHWQVVAQEDGVTLLMELEDAQRLPTLI